MTPFGCATSRAHSGERQPVVGRNGELLELRRGERRGPLAPTASRTMKKGTTIGERWTMAHSRLPLTATVSQRIVASDPPNENRQWRRIRPP